MEIRRIVISRTDAIGDVVLTLPMAGLIKKHLPDCHITFLGRTYTEPIIKRSQFIDDFINWDEFEPLSIKERTNLISTYAFDAIIHVFPLKAIAKVAKQSKIPIRIGTSHRFYHLLNCNKLLNLGRKNTNLHETQLNLKLLKPLLIDDVCSLQDIPDLYGFRKTKPVNPQINSHIDPNRFNLILHPTSRGSAREWGLDNFSRLIEILPMDKFKIFVTGTETDGKLIEDGLIANHPELHNLTGKLSLNELIDFIALSDGIVSASTGPLHIAAALGKYALGLYSPMRPIHSGRWAPLGKNAQVFTLDNKCNKCRNQHQCPCIAAIQPQVIMDALTSVIPGKQ